MTVETETILMKFLEEFKADFKETNRKLDKFIETTNETLTKIQINQVRLEGKVETLAVEIQNIKEDVRELKTEVKEVKTEQKDVRNDLSGLYKWVIVLIVGSGLSLGTLLLKAFDFFPKA